MQFILITKCYGLYFFDNFQKINYLLSFNNILFLFLFLNKFYIWVIKQLKER